MGFLVGAIINFLGLLELLIFIDAIMSWFIRPRSNDISRIIGIIVDPLLAPCRNLQRKFITNSPIDFSPIIALVIIELVKTLISNIF
jgi:YggT family protein